LPERFKVRENDDRTFDVYEDGRPVFFSLPSISDAEYEVAGRGGSQFDFEEVDGYITTRYIR